MDGVRLRGGDPLTAPTVWMQGEKEFNFITSEFILFRSYYLSLSCLLFILFFLGFNFSLLYSLFSLSYFLCLSYSLSLSLLLSILFCSHYPFSSVLTVVQNGVLAEFEARFDRLLGTLTCIENKSLILSFPATIYFTPVRTY